MFTGPDLFLIFCFISSACWCMNRSSSYFWFLIRYVHSPVLPSGEWHDPENLGRIGSQGTWSFHELSIGNWKLCSKSFGVFFTQPVGKFEDEEHTSWEKMFFGYPRLLRVQSTSPPILIYRAIHPGESTIGVCGIPTMVSKQISTKAPKNPRIDSRPPRTHLCTGLLTQVNKTKGPFQLLGPDVYGYFFVYFERIFPLIEISHLI